MESISRPGIDQKWEKSWKNTCAKLKKWNEVELPIVKEELDYFIANGVMQLAVIHPAPTVFPPMASWERYLDSSIYMYARGGLHSLEIRCMTGEPFDVQLARWVFSGIYLYECINIYTICCYPSRSGGRALRAMSDDGIFFSALGLVAGAREQATQLIRAQLTAFRKGLYCRMQHYPIAFFMFRMLADFLELPPLHPVENALEEPILEQLYMRWQEPDPGALVEICVAACDFHTHRCVQGKRGARAEFQHFEFTRLPIELLLLFKLRQMSGLQSPKIDHPLMNSPLGQLPQEAISGDHFSRPDDIINRTRARMVKDGFDEQAILEQMLNY